MIMPETIALIGQDISKIYEEIDNYIDLYSVRELANVLLSALPGVKLAKVERDGAHKNPRAPRDLAT